MGIGAGRYMYYVIVKSSHSLSHLLMSFLLICTSLFTISGSVQAAQHFRTICLLWPNGWMYQDATWYEGRPRPRPHCVTWGPSSPS